MPKYPGQGLATLINANQQIYLFGGSGQQTTSPERPGAGSPSYASIAYGLERQKAAFYPWGFAVEIWFTGAPGTFEVDIQGAELDMDSHYVTIGTAITAVNASNVGRFDSGVTIWPKYVRAFVKTLGNDVSITAVLTR
jgi:hypothetical protein